MGLPRSTFYDAPSLAVDDVEIVGRMQAICDEFETYGYRRVGAALRQQGVVVNAKKVRRLMREHDLQPRRRRRFVATTDSAHDLPVFPNLAPEVVPDGPNQLQRTSNEEGDRRPSPHKRSAENELANSPNSTWAQPGISGSDRSGRKGRTSSMY